MMVGQLGFDGMWLRVSGALSSLLGYSRSELQGLRIKDVIHPGDVEWLARECSRLVSGESESFEMVTRCVCRDGSTPWVRLNFSVGVDVASFPSHLVVCLVRVSERQQVGTDPQPGQRSSEDLTRNLIASSSRLLAERCPGALLKTVAKTSRSLTNARDTLVATKSVETGAFELQAVASVRGDDVDPAMDPGLASRLEYCFTVLETQASLRCSPAEWAMLQPGHVSGTDDSSGGSGGLVATRLVRADGRIWGAVVAVDKVAGEFTSEDEAMLVELSSLASAVHEQIQGRDALELQAAELQQARIDLETRVGERTETLKRALWRLGAVSELLELANSEAFQDRFLAAVVHRLQGWCGCTAAGVRLLNEDRRMPFVAAVGFHRRFLRCQARAGPTVGHCRCLAALEVHCTTASAGARFAQGLIVNGGEMEILPTSCGIGPLEASVCVGEGYRSVVCVPISSGGKLIGAIHLADAQEGRFTEETVELLHTLAGILADAIGDFAAQAALEESEARCRALFEDNQDPMLLVSSANADIIDGNPAAARFWGCSRERLRARNLGGLGLIWPSEDTLPTFEHPIRVVEQVLSLPGQEDRIVELRTSEIAVGRRRMLFVIVRDLTEQKRLEREILEISESERQRTGRDLHDSLGAKLTGLAVLGKALAHRLAAKLIPEAAAAQELASHLQAAVGRVQSIARGLWPLEVSPAGLPARLRLLAQETAKEGEVPCVFHEDPSAVVDDALQATHLFRIAEEAVHNAMRHSSASQIVVQLKRDGSAVRLSVKDDGQGISADARTSPGLGMRSMRYRASQLGGGLEVKQGPEGGTLIECSIPVANLPQTGSAQ